MAFSLTRIAFSYTEGWKFDKLLPEYGRLSFHRNTWEQPRPELNSNIAEGFDELHKLVLYHTKSSKLHRWWSHLVCCLHRKASLLSSGPWCRSQLFENLDASGKVVTTFLDCLKINLVIKFSRKKVVPMQSAASPCWQPATLLCLPAFEWVPGQEQCSAGLQLLPVAKSSPQENDVMMLLVLKPMLFTDPHV